mmetsp:Transcript_10909/g.15889  ORF Transcript_10909/g.15889 Transcript_10909/m.15889 type:complete len:156 (+) Transcript_10909:132-599(+)
MQPKGEIYSPLDTSDPESLTFATRNPDEATTGAPVGGSEEGILNIDTAVAVAVPNSIRPPKVVPADSNPASTRVKKLSILMVGLFVSYMNFVQAIVFIYLGFGNKIMVTAGTVWFLSAVSLLLGGIYGAFKGQWRMLVPGILLSHLSSFVVRMVA